MLVDARNLAFRCFSLSTKLKDDEGTFVNVPFISIKILTKIFKSIHPTRVVLVWDGGRSARRKALHPGYKVPSGEPDPNWQRVRQQIDEQLVYTKPFFSALGLAQITIAGCEADDIIDCCCHAPDIGKVVIVSSDNDFYQLLDRDISMWRFQCEEEDKLYTVDKFFSENGYHPRLDYFRKLVTGDKADAITGIKGIGEKSVQPFIASVEKASTLKFDEILELWRQWCEEKKGRCAKYLEDPANVEILKKNYALMKLGEEVLTEEVVAHIWQKLLRKVPFNAKVVNEFLVQHKMNSMIKEYVTWIQPFQSLGVTA